MGRYRWRGINVFESNKRTAIYKKRQEHYYPILSKQHSGIPKIIYGSELLKEASVFIVHIQKTFRLITPMGKTNLDVRTFHEDERHHIWIGCSQGIFVYDSDKMKVIQHYDTSNSELHSKLIRSIIQDEKGRLWIGTFGDGLGIYTPRSPSDQKVRTKRWFLFQHHQPNISRQRKKNVGSYRRRTSMF